MYARSALRRASSSTDAAVEWMVNAASEPRFGLGCPHLARISIGLRNAFPLRRAR